MDNSTTPPAGDKPQAGERQAWNRPRVASMKAGDAEIGANPIKVEGALAKGS